MRLLRTVFPSFHIPGKVIINYESGNEELELELANHTRLGGGGGGNILSTYEPV